MKWILSEKMGGHQASIYCLCATDDPNSFLSSGGDGMIVSWNLAEPNLGKIFARNEEGIFCMFYQSVKSILFCGDMKGQILAFDYPQKKIIKKWKAHQGSVFKLLYLDQGLLSVGADGILHLWDSKEYRLKQSFTLSSKSLRTIAYEPKHNKIVAAGSEGKFYFFELKNNFLDYTGQKQAHDSSIFSLAFTPSHNYLLSGSRDAYIKIWNPETLEPVPTEPAHLSTINDLCLSEDGSNFFSAGRDKHIKIWSLDQFKLIQVLDSIRDMGHHKSVNCLLYLNQKLISAGDDRQIIIWSQVKEK